MAEVKAQFPVGKTQWAKWRTEQRIAFNEARESGVPFPDAVKYVNGLELVEVNIAPRPEPKKKKSILDVVEDAVDTVTEVAEVAAKVSPVVAIAKTVVKATKKKGK